MLIINEKITSLYSFMIIIALLFGFTYIYRNLRINSIKKEPIFLSLILSLYCIFLGGKYFTIMTTNDKNINFINAGLSSYGGFIGLIVAVFIFTAIYKEKRKIFLSTYIVSLPLIYSISKLGCFLAGCCYGIKYSGVFSVCYLGKEEKSTVFPIQLLETILFLVIFIILGLLNRKNKNKYICEITIAICAICKFILDYFRNAHIGMELSVNQYFSIILILFVIIRIIIGKFKIKII